MYTGKTVGEVKAADQLVTRLLMDKLYTISVNDGEEWAIKRSTDKVAILDAMGNTDVDILRIRHNAEDGAIVGSIVLVWGNADDGSDLVSDYSDNPTIDALIHAHWAERGDI